MSSPGTYFAVTFLCGPGGTNVIGVTKSQNYDRTAAQLKTLLENEAGITEHFTIALAGSGAGSIDNEHTQTYLTGGADLPQIVDCHPSAPTDYVISRTIYYFDNGQTYTNRSAGSVVLLTLPPARVGWEYHFEVAAAQELRLDPDGTETIALNGVQQGAGKYIVADAIGERCTLKCITTGRWEQSDIIGTWTAEP